MKEFKYNMASSKPTPLQNKPVFSKSPQINFSYASKSGNNSNLFNKIIGKNPFEQSREKEKSPMPSSQYAYANNYGVSMSKSPLKLLNYLYSKQQQENNNKKASMNISSNAKQFIQMKIQNNDSANAVYQINLKKNQHLRSQSMHKDPQATEERGEKEILSSKDRITDKSPLRFTKNSNENKHQALQRKGSGHERNFEEPRKEYMKYGEKMEKSFTNNVFNDFNSHNPSNQGEKIEFKIGKNIDRATIEKQMLEFKKKSEEEKIKMLVQKQKEEQEMLENNLEENIENNNKNYNFEPFVNFSNFKSIKMKPKVKESEVSSNNKISSNAPISIQKAI